MSSRRAYMRALLAALSMLAPAASRAQQAYPSSRITLVVPFAAGGPTDVVARLVGDHMSKSLGQAIVIENIAGAGGTLGMTHVAQARPDGYTLGMGNLGTQSAAVALYASLKYDPATSFQQIGIVSNTPEVIVAKAATKASSLAEFIAYLKQENKRLVYGHAGTGSVSHVAGIVFSRQIGIEPAVVAYRGTGPALGDLIAGHIDFMIDQALNVIPQINAGTIVAYGVAGPARLASIPNVPTAHEGGLDFEFSAWNALVAPKGLPAETTRTLVSALNSALDDPSIVARLGELGGTAPSAAERGPAALQSLVEAEVVRIKAAVGSTVAEQDPKKQ